MTAAYFDSSALVKLVIDENGSDSAALLWDRADSVLTSRVAYPEVRAALAAAHRSARLDVRSHRRATADWVALHQAVRFAELTAQLEVEAGDLAEKHALSGFDAIHLASSLTIASMPIVVATWDHRLHLAAQAEGLATLPEQL